MGQKEARRWNGIDRCRELIKESKTRELTAEEILLLKKEYTGYGGLYSGSWSNNGQFFTPPNITKFILDLLQIPSGTKVLEPSAGAGAFFEFLPKGCDVTGIEITQEAAEVVRLCYPNINVIRGDALSMLSDLEGKFDFCIGNPPFMKLNPGNRPDGYTISEKGKGKAEWYFTELAVRSLKPGGLAALVLPDSIFSTSSDAHLRKWVAVGNDEENPQCWYIGTVSLPKETFYFSGTSVSTSIMFIQKKIPGVDLGGYSIFMAICENIGWDSRGRQTGQCDLDKILAAYRDRVGTDFTLPVTPQQKVKYIVETSKKYHGQLCLDFGQAS